MRRQGNSESQREKQRKFPGGTVRHAGSIRSYLSMDEALITSQGQMIIFANASYAHYPLGDALSSE